MWKFIKSSSDKSNWYIHDKKEICFIGRSNVGKSSLINALSGNSKLAKTSKTPGRTQLINYFETDDGKIIVDLPGYGFANISHSSQEKMFAMVDQYFKEATPDVVFLLIDARRGIMNQDQNIIDHLLDLNHNVVLIITKTDKATQKEMSACLKSEYFSKLKYLKSDINNYKKIETIKQFINEI